MQNKKITRVIGFGKLSCQDGFLEKSRKDGDPVISYPDPDYPSRGFWEYKDVPEDDEDDEAAEEVAQLALDF